VVIFTPPQALPLVKDNPVPNEYEGRCAPEPVLTLQRKAKSYSCRESSPGCPARIAIKNSHQLISEVTQNILENTRKFEHSHEPFNNYASVL
jgi:hypothetical protein